LLPQLEEWRKTGHLDEDFKVMLEHDVHGCYEGDAELLEAFLKRIIGREKSE
jgi:hypothetical protein